MTMYAKIVTDSISNEIRLTTLELYYPLMIHAQLMTHRMFSRNAQSNRAMPVNKMLEQVKGNPAMPSQWGKNQPGMSASEELDSEIGEAVWYQAALRALDSSKALADRGYHKQVANRLTMPFQYIKVIVTATEWDNFFKLRLNDADPTMMELAGKMREAMDGSVPIELDIGQYHLPYISFRELSDTSISTEILIKCSVARCARVSYNNHDNSSPNVAKDIALADRLLRDGHMSCFEHQATPMKHTNENDHVYLYNDDGPIDWEKGITHVARGNDFWSNNFRGFIQYRTLV